MRDTRIDDAVFDKVTRSLKNALKELRYASLYLDNQCLREAVEQKRTEVKNVLDELLQKKNINDSFEAMKKK